MIIHWKSGIYDGLIPPEALVVKITNNSFGTSGMANTSDRPIWLINTLDDTLESYFYSANNSQTHSDEKIILNKDSSRKVTGQIHLLQMELRDLKIQ